MRGHITSADWVTKASTTTMMATQHPNLMKFQRLILLFPMTRSLFLFSQSLIEWYLPSPPPFPFLLSLSLSLTFLPLHIKIIIKKRGKKKKCFFPFFSKNSKPTKKEGFFRCTPQPATFSLPRSRARLQSYLSIFDPIFVALRPQSPFHSIPGKKIAHFSSIQQKMHWKGKMKKRKMWRKFFFSLYRAITSQGGGI